MVSAPRFRFGIQAPTVTGRREWVELARRAEDLGYAVLCTADHLDACLPPLVPLVLAAAATTTLRVATLVCNNDLRHPSLLAREAATVDLLSDGRLELGLGAGHAFGEYERNGLRFDPPGVRVERLAESVSILRRLLDGETVHHEGRHYVLDGETCWPRPAQARVPLLVGGGGSRVLSLAAREADTVGLTGLGPTLADGNRHSPSGFPPAVVDEQVAGIRAAAASRGDGPELQALVQAVVVTDRPEAVAADLVAGRLPSLTPAEVLGSPYLLVGTPSAVADELRAHRERWGISYFTVRADAVDTFAPVVAELAGR